MPEHAKNPVRSTEKTIRIVETLVDLDGAGVTELANNLGMSKSTVHHHLTTLEEHELVTKEDDQYHIGIRFFELGEYARQRQRIYEVGRPEVDRLALETGELANLMIEEHGRGVYIHIAEGENAVRLDTTVGTKQYLHTCALGKAMLAQMPEERVGAILDHHGLPAETSNTVTSREELFADLVETRERGVAFDGEERAEAITCVAAPVSDSEGDLLGAISISGPSSRMKGDRLYDEIPELVTNAAEIVGINASYS